MVGSLARYNKGDREKIPVITSSKQGEKRKCIAQNLLNEACMSYIVISLAMLGLPFFIVQENMLD